MIDAFINVCFCLALKAFNDGLLLIKLLSINQALKFELSELLLDLREHQLNGIILRAVWNIHNPHDSQLPHLVFHRCCLVCRQIVHHNG